MTESHRIKTQLRSTLQQHRKTLSPSAQRAAAQALTNAVVDLPNWASAQRIALYLAANGEIDTKPLENLARSAGKQLFLPVINDDNSLSFARWYADDRLSNNRFNIPEPPASAPRCVVAQLHIIFLPLVGWDLHGGRLGMGGGFYDRTLSGNSGPLLVGLAHDSQQVEEVPQESWDIRLDYIATDGALYRRQGKQDLVRSALLREDDAGL
jgi:5-formyltetrahydrofolate cyclo-ligase